MQLSKPFLLAVLVLAVASCSGVKTRADYSNDVDFSSYATYAWLPQYPTPDISEIIVARIQAAVDGELARKGLELVPESEADLMVTQQAGVREKIQTNDPYYSYQPYEVYEEGTLRIDLVDAERRTLVWSGTGQMRLADVDSVEAREERATKIVRAILEKYPPH